MARAKAVRGRPEIEADAQGPLRKGSRSAWDHAQERITDIDRYSPRIHITEAHKEVRVLQTGFDREIGLDRPDDLQVLIEGGAGIRQNVRPFFQSAVISRQ